MKLALTNVPPVVAESLARTLVEEGCAACVNATPIRSTYRWKGEICVEDEVTLVMKVADAGGERLRQRLLALHPYELPEFIVLDVESAGSLPAYVQWVETETGAGSRE